MTTANVLAVMQRKIKEDNAQLEKLNFCGNCRRGWYTTGIAGSKKSYCCGRDPSTTWNRECYSFFAKNILGKSPYNKFEPKKADGTTPAFDVKDYNGNSYEEEESAYYRKQVHNSNEWLSCLWPNMHSAGDYCECDDGYYSQEQEDGNGVCKPIVESVTMSMPYLGHRIGTSHWPKRQNEVKNPTRQRQIDDVSEHECTDIVNNFDGDNIVGQFNYQQGSNKGRCTIYTYHDGIVPIKSLSTPSYSTMKKVYVKGHGLGKCLRSLGRSGDDRLEDLPSLWREIDYEKVKDAEHCVMKDQYFEVEKKEDCVDHNTLRGKHAFVPVMRHLTPAECNAKFGTTNLDGKRCRHLRHNNTYSNTNGECSKTTFLYLRHEKLPASRSKR